MMKYPTNLLSLRGAFLLSLCSVVAWPVAGRAENPPPENAQALLEKVKKNDRERQVVAKQTELDRLAQDLAKEHKDAEVVEKSIGTTGEALKASSAALEQLQNDKKRMEAVLELTTLRIEAERLKVQGLQQLADAQNKSLNALTKRAVETEARASLGAAELKILAGETPIAPSTSTKARSPLWELRKKLAISETAAESADRVAEDAMKTATIRLEQADVASVRVKRKAEGMEGEALAPIAEKPEGEKEVPAIIMPREKK